MPDEKELLTTVDTETGTAATDQDLDDGTRVGSEEDATVGDADATDEDPALGLEGSPKAQERVRDQVEKRKTAEAERDAANALRDAAIADREALAAERAKDKAEHEALLAQQNFEQRRQEWITQDQRVLDDLNRKLSAGEVDEALAQTQWELYQARRASEFRELQVNAQSQQLTNSQKELREAKIERELATLTKTFDTLDDDDLEDVKALHLAGRGELKDLAKKRHDKNVKNSDLLKNAADIAKTQAPPPKTSARLSGEGGAIATGRKDAMPDPDKDPVKWEAWFDRKKMEGHRLKEQIQ